MKSTTQTYYEVTVAQVKIEDECKSVDICKSSGCERNLCWGKGSCQILHLDQCHPLCAGGCYENNSADHCYACRGLVTNEGKCVSTCPPQTYVYLQRNCITQEQCRTQKVKPTKDNPGGYNYFTFNNSCISECPSRYRKNHDNTTCIPCEGASCFKECYPAKDTNYPDRYRITLVSESKRLQSCTRIKGSLIIDGIQGSYHRGIEEALEENLGMIEEIDGRLEVIHSHALISLNFFRNLRLIEGNPFNGSQADENRYSLTVKDNKNLQELWDWDKRPNGAGLQIPRGKVFFHFNPKLCLTEIERMGREANLQLPFTNLEVSRESNGYQSICNPTAMNVTVESRTAHSVILALHLAPNTSTENIGRFMVFYKEASEFQTNESTHDSFSECESQWRVNNYDGSTFSNGTLYMLITRLEPYVEYFYFVRSYTTLSSSIGTTSIKKVQTLPDQPSTPLEFRTVNVTESEVTVSWKPPFHPHGVITHYIIEGYWQNDVTEDLKQRDYCLYRMQKNEAFASKPSFPTTTEPMYVTPLSAEQEKQLKDARCKKKCNKVKNITQETEQTKFEYCNSFDHVNEIDPAITNDELIACDAFIYSVMNSNFQKLSTLQERKPMDTNTMTKTAPSQFPMDQYNVPKVKPSPNETNLEGKYVQFRVSVNANSTETSIANLKHFSEYILLISACQDTHPQVKDPCSRYTFLSVRTGRSSQADQVDKSKIRVAPNNHTANVSWEEPNTVNSYVHSYILEYRSTDVENSKFIENCITTNQFHDANGSYAIENLSSGHYQLRLRAVSLAGEGYPVTTTFTIEEQSKQYMSIIVSSVVIVMVIMCILIAFLYYWRLQISKNRILFASVNPRYEPVYVEDHWEVAREHLTLVKQLGRGTFGSVHEGILQPDNTRCAVKTVTAVSDEDNMIFLKEATLMKEFHKAFHIVKLIGVISKGTPVYVIMELMEMGDLKSFLLRHGAELTDDSKTMPAQVILKMAAEIADGMAFLEAKKFVHRDLAARNCMVSGNRIIKIGDFGLARDIYETDYYRKGDKGTLPIRWMAPESIRDGIFTSNSDVWSYGVVLWEITTLAQMPYHPRTNEEVIKYVQSGQILDVPANAHEVLRPLMRCCWRWHASHRPKFVQILKLLDSYVDHNFRKVSFFHNGEDPNDPTNVVPCRTATEECYIYSDENDEINLYLSQSPSTSTSTPSGTKATRYVPYRANGHVENLR
ncbi:insulin receptor-like isoform X2 [Planococcus citri]